MEKSTVSDELVGCFSTEGNELKTNYEKLRKVAALMKQRIVSAGER